MRLPGPSFDRGQSSLGREGDGAVRQYEVASRTGLETAKAKNAVYNELQRLGESATAWDQATQEAEADAALADFASEMTEAETVISNTRAFKADEVPTSVQFERFEKAADGTDVPVDMVASWKVAPQLYDHYQRQSSDKALSRVSGATREKLRVRIQGMTADANRRIQNQYFKDRRDDIRSTTEGAITQFVNAENTAGALSAIDTAVKNGVFSVDEGRQAAQTALQNAEVVSVDRFIGATRDPAILDKFAADIGSPDSSFRHMTPGQRVNAMQLAQNKSATLAAQQLAAYDRARRDHGDAVLNRALTAYTLNGTKPSAAEIAQAEQSMSSTQFKAYVKLAAPESGVSNPQAVREVTTLVGNLTNADKFVNEQGVQITVEDYYMRVREDLSTRFAQGEISPDTFKEQNAIATGFMNGLFASDTYKDAEKFLADAIVPAPFSTLPGETDTTARVISNRAQNDLRLAISQNPKTNPTKWANDNVGRYQRAIQDEKVRELNEQGTASSIVINKAGRIDIELTTKALHDQRRQHFIDDETLERSINLLHGIK